MTDANRSSHLETEEGMLVLDHLNHTTISQAIQEGEGDEEEGVSIRETILQRRHTTTSIIDGREGVRRCSSHSPTTTTTTATTTVKDDDDEFMMTFSRYYKDSNEHGDKKKTPTSKHQKPFLFRCHSYTSPTTSIHNYKGLNVPREEHDHKEEPTVPEGYRVVAQVVSNEGSEKELSDNNHNHFSRADSSSSVSSLNQVQQLSANTDVSTEDFFTSVRNSIAPMPPPELQRDQPPLPSLTNIARDKVLPDDIGNEEHQISATSSILPGAVRVVGNSHFHDRYLHHHQQELQQQDNDIEEEEEEGQVLIGGGEEAGNNHQVDNDSSSHRSSIDGNTSSTDATRTAVPDSNNDASAVSSTQPQPQPQHQPDQEDETAHCERRRRNISDLLRASSSSSFFIRNSRQRPRASSSIRTTQSGNYIIEAFPVESITHPNNHHHPLTDSMLSQIERDIRHRIITEAVEATTVCNDESYQYHDCTTSCHAHPDNVSRLESEAKDRRRKTKLIRILICALILILLGIVVGLGIGLSGGNNSDQSSSQKDTAASAPTVLSSSNADQNMNDIDTESLSTLEIVQKRGYIICGHSDFGLTNKAKDGNPQGDLYEGFNVEQCKAMALLALGDSTKYKQHQVDFYTRWVGLTEKRIDILIVGSTHTMQRDVYWQDSNTGYTNTVPYFYSGLTFGGNPSFVECAENLDDFNGACRDLKVCVRDGSTHVGVLANLMRGGVSVPYNETTDLALHLNAGACNVVAAEPLYLGKLRQYFDGEWKISPYEFSKEPLTVVTREDDPEWSNLANLMVNTFILAEAYNISSANSHEMVNLVPKSDLSVDASIASNEFDLAAKMALLVDTFGNYGDLYKKHIEQVLPIRSNINSVYDNSKSTGLLYSFPFGDIIFERQDQNANNALDRLTERGYLLCGIQPFRGPGFAHHWSNVSTYEGSNATLESRYESDPSSWTGFDVEFCNALSAALFEGSKEKVKFLKLDDMNDAYSALSSHRVDVVAGARVTLQADYHEPVTGQGYTFSVPYYYDNESKDAFGLMTREEDVKWSDFVYWIVMALIYAEEEGISFGNSRDMPVVASFGSLLRQMFRDCISAVGSYADIYRNTLQAFIPRSGANFLNKHPKGPQQFPMPPV